MKHIPWYLRARTGLYLCNLSGGLLLAFGVRLWQTGGTLTSWHIALMFVLILGTRIGAFMHGLDLGE